MVRVFYPPRIVNRLHQLRREGWDMVRDTSDPQINIRLWRDGVELAAQAVVLTYLTSGGRPFSSSKTRQMDGAVESLSDVRMRRRMSDGFDVQVGDRFEVDGLKGTIGQVTRDRGMIWASGHYDSGSP